MLLNDCLEKNQSYKMKIIQRNTGYLLNSEFLRNAKTID